MKFELKTFNRNIPDEDLINDLKNVAKELEKETVTSREYDGKGKYRSGTIAERFGSWNHALEEAGLIVKEHKNIGNEELISDLRKVAGQLGKETITSREYNVYGKFTSGTIAERFGSWNKALEEAMLIVKEHKNISIEALFENIEQVWMKLGRQPTHRDMKFPLSKYTSHAYQTNFGTWRKALEKFVEFSNSEEAEIDSIIEARSIVAETEQSIETITEIVPRHKTKRNINLRLRIKVLMRDGSICKVCGRSPQNTPGTILHVDHIQAWNNGGETVLENLQILCSVCNIGKSNLDFLQEQ